MTPRRRPAPEPEPVEPETTEETAQAATDVPEPVEPTPAPDPAPAVARIDRDPNRYEPYPGRAFFHGGRNSPIVRAVAVRLQQEGHVDRRLGPDWTRAHQTAFARYQESLHPNGGDTSGIPDEAAWDHLCVPRVTPAPKREG